MPRTKIARPGKRALPRAWPIPKRSIFEIACGKQREKEERRKEEEGSLLLACLLKDATGGAEQANSRTTGRSVIARNLGALGAASLEWNSFGRAR